MHRPARVFRMLAAAAVAACAAPAIPAAGSRTPTASAPLDHATLERQVLAELNAARTNPVAYAARVEALIPLFEGSVLRRPGEIGIRTREGAAAVREAAAALRATARMGAVTLSAGMTRGARDHVRDQAAGRTGHGGSDGSNTAARVNRYGRWTVRLTESISYGPSTGADVIQGLIVDDGVPDRGHRRNLLDPAVRVAGIACGPHAAYRVACVIDLAGGYEER